MSGINLKLLIVAVVTISLLLIAGALLVSTLNPVKTPPSPIPSPSPTPAVTTSQSTSEPTTIQEAPAQEAAPTIAPTSGVKPGGAEAGEPFYGEIGGGPAGGQSASQ